MKKRKQNLPRPAVHRMELWWAALPTVPGHVQRGTRPALIMLYAACSTMILSMGTPQSLLKAYRLSTLGRLRPCCQW